MGDKVELFDHGYISLVKVWGSDEEVIETARMSTQKGFLGWGPQHEESCSSIHPVTRSFGGPCNCNPKPGDERLLGYMWTHGHLTPFESCGATFEVKAPIVVFREWHRHRTQSYNEASARYGKLPNENYVPTLERVLQANISGTKQAGSIVNPENQEQFEIDVEVWLDELEAYYADGENLYQRGLNIGIPKELARLPVTVGRYSKMRASANLRNWMQFLTLRCSNDAMFEIRSYAKAIADMLASKFPRTLGLWNETNQ